MPPPEETNPEPQLGVKGSTGSRYLLSHPSVLHLARFLQQQLTLV